MESIEYPLEEIYRRLQRMMPTLDLLKGEAVSEPYKSLLVHEQDMTPTLMKFHRASLFVTALSSFREGDFYYREVLLRTVAEKPVLYGAIKINLALLPPEVVESVLAEKEPFGGILANYKIVHSSSPSAFFSLKATEFISNQLNVERESLLFGRRNTLFSENKLSLAEIVEVLPQEKDTMEKKYDVVVMGAGPAGTCSAALLAEKGLKVILFDRQPFPRYKIGESMIPYCYYSLQRLGILDKMKNSHFQKKLSVQFVGQSGKLSTPFYFVDHMKHEAGSTWQVNRSEFDQLLLDNAVSKGVEFYDNSPIKEFLRDAHGQPYAVKVDLKGEETVFQAEMFLDCTGRDAISMHKNRWRVADPMLKKMAIWTYYKGAMRDPGIDGGATTVAYVPNNGWFWYIPLHGDIVSIGIVAEKDYLFSETSDLKTIFEREVEKNLWIKEHLAPGTRTEEFRVTSEYSYRSKHCAEDRVLLVGDAFAFLDPVFSSGMFLALYSGVLAADAVLEAFAKKDFSAVQFTNYGKVLCSSIESMRSLVYAFYNPNFNFGKFIKKYPHLHGDLTDCLIGNLYRNFDELFKAMKEFADIPEHLSHGQPFIKEQATVP